MSECSRTLAAVDLDVEWAGMGTNATETVPERVEVESAEEAETLP
jgi:hypothetical protein